MSQRKNNRSYDKYAYQSNDKVKSIDTTSDKQMIEEGLRHPLVNPRYDYSKTTAEQKALKAVKNSYNAAMRAYYGASWSKKRANKTVDGNFNMPTKVLSDGRFEVRQQPAKISHSKK